MQSVDIGHKPAADDGTNIALAMQRIAEREPSRPALVVLRKNGRPRSIDYAELATACDRCANALVDLGLRRGHRVLMLVRPGVEFAVVSFALLKIGAAPVFVDPAMGLGRLRACIETARPEAFVGVPAAHVLRMLFRRTFRSVKLAIAAEGTFPGATSLRRMIERGPPHPLAAVHAAPSDLAGIAFTSGSTGIPKGVEWSHGNFAAQLEAYRHLFTRDAAIDLVTFPVFLLPALALGNTCVLPVMDFARPGSVDPERIVDAIRSWQPTFTFGSPALFRRVVEHCRARRIQLSSLRAVATGGAPIAPALVEQMREVFPQAMVSTPYGATEALPVAFIGAPELEALADKTLSGRGTCLGKPVPGVRVRIIPITNEPIEVLSETEGLPEHGIGEIIVSGGVVTEQYLERPDLTVRAKIREPETGRLWHRMGDAGYVDEQGRIWFCGRVQHRIAHGSELYYPVMLEGIFDAHPDVRKSSFVGVVRDGRTEFVLAVEAGTRGLEPLRRDLLELARRHELPPFTILFRRTPLPVDRRHNAKLDVEAISAWAQAEVGRRAR